MNPIIVRTYLGCFNGASILNLKQQMISKHLINWSQARHNATISLLLVSGTTIMQLLYSIVYFKIPLELKSKN